MGGGVGNASPVSEPLNEAAWLADSNRDTTLSSNATPDSKKPPRKTAGIWGESLSSSGTGTVGPGNYPAKYSFNGGVSCSDYVAFNTSLAGSAGTPATQSTTIGTLTIAGASGKTITIAGTVYTASAPSAETATMVSRSTLPTGSVTIGSDTYSFVNASTVSTPVSSTSCNIRSV